MPKVFATGTLLRLVAGHLYGAFVVHIGKYVVVVQYFFSDCPFVIAHLVSDGNRGICN